MRTLWWRAFTVAVASLAIVMTAGSAGRGEEFGLSADATLQEEYQDNVLFSSTGKKSSWLTTLAPGGRVRFGNDHTSAHASARWEGRMYSTDNDLNAINHLYAAAVEHRRARASAGVSLNLIRDTTLDSELRQTGLVLGRDPRYSGVVGADLGYALSELTRTTWRYRYTETRYTVSALVDYVNHGVQWETRRVLSEADQSIGLAVHAAFLDADPAYRSQEWSATGSYVHPLSERDQVSLTAGGRWTRVEAGLPSSAVATDAGLVGEASVTRRWEAANVSLAVSKRTNPSGSGRLLDTTRVALHAAYALTDRATATLTADGYRNVEVVFRDGRTDSTFIRIEPTISWRPGERVTVTAAYTRERQRRESGRIDANRAMVRLAYEWYRWE